MFFVHLCVCWKRKGETINSQILNINGVVSDLWLQASHKNTQLAEKNVFSFLLPGRKEEETGFICDPFHTSLWICLGAHMGVSLRVHYTGSTSGCPEIRSVIVSSLGEGGRVCDRLQWLVELSGQNLSDSAEAMNHFGLQFVSHSTSHNNLDVAGAWKLAVHPAVLPCACLTMPPAAGCMWISWLPRGWNISRLHGSAFCRKEI